MIVSYFFHWSIGNAGKVKKLNCLIPAVNLSILEISPGDYYYESAQPKEDDKDVSLPVCFG